MRRIRWILPLILIVLIGAVLFTMRLATADEPDSVPDPPSPGPMHRVGPIITDLHGAENEPTRHIRVDIKIEVVDDIALGLVSCQQGRVKNEILSALRSFHPEQIEGQRGMNLLRRSILERLRHLFDSETVRDLHYLQFIIQ